MKHIPVIGPGKKGAQLEGSKDFSKQFMARHGIPTARYLSVTGKTVHDAVAFMKELKPPYVLKADGLAAGKGVLIIDDFYEAVSELYAMLEGKFGEASRTVVIEQYLRGIECSVFVLTDGKHYKLLPVAKDYKRVGEGDTGLNTGGMGAVSPVPFADEAFMQQVEKRITRASSSSASSTCRTSPTSSSTTPAWATRRPRWSCSASSRTSWTSSKAWPRKTSTKGRWR